MKRTWDESLGIEAGVGLWLLLGIFFILRVPDKVHTYDVEGHIQYTQIIAREHRLPAPLEGHETFQPPLYYLINSRIAPDSPRHIFWVRYLSVFYGAIALGCIGGLLTELGIPVRRQIIIMAFLITTPMFVFLFSSYNNDALATLFSMLILFLLARLAHHWDGKTAAGLWLASVAGLYTKFTVGFTLIAAAATVLLIGLCGHWPHRKMLPTLGILLTPPLLLIPWLVFHNHAATGRYLPTNYDAGFPKEIALPQTPTQTLLAIPCLTPHEWQDPFAHLWEDTGTKKSSYFSYRFCTSLFGEYIFSPALVLLAWGIVALHLSVLLWSVQYVHRSRAAQAALLIIFLSALPHYLYLRSCPYGAAMDYRLIAWVWMPWAVVYGEAASVTLAVLMTAGVALQGMFLCALMR